MKTTFSNLLLAFVLTGCTQNHPATTTQDPFFQSPDEVPLATRLFDTQAARGARVDATLYPQHFDGQRLNSLGKSKIDLMLRDTESEPPLKLFISGQSTDPTWTARADAVKKHLTSVGLTDKQFQVVAGINPDTWHPVAKDIDATNKPDAAKPDGDTNPATPSSPTASAPPTGK